MAPVVLATTPLAAVAGPGGARAAPCPSPRAPRTALLHPAPALQRRGPAAPRAAPDDKTRRAWEAELKDPESFLGYLLPRPLRVTLLGATAVACTVGALTEAGRLAGGQAEGGGTLAIDLAGLAGSAWLAVRDQKGAEKRVEQREARAEAQIAAGDRERVVDQSTGEVVGSKLRPVDDDWIVKRLEKWGRQDQLPFLGPAKADIVQDLVRSARPKMVFEVGTMFGYSAIKIAQALPEGSKLVTVEKDLFMGLWAKRYLWQASEGRREGNPVGDKVDVRLGDAREVVARLPAPVDLLFLDGTPKEYLSYLEAAEPHLAPGATVIADNAGVFADGGLKNYLEYVRGSPIYDTRFVESTLEWREDVPDGIEVSVFRGRTAG